MIRLEKWPRAHGGSDPRESDARTFFDFSTHIKKLHLSLTEITFKMVAIYTIESDFGSVDAKSVAHRPFFP